MKNNVLDFEVIMQQLANTEVYITTLDGCQYYGLLLEAYADCLQIAIAKVGPVYIRYDVIAAVRPKRTDLDIPDADGHTISKAQCMGGPL